MLQVFVGFYNYNENLQNKSKLLFMRQVFLIFNIQEVGKL